MSLNIPISQLLFRIATLIVFGAAVHICIILIMPYVSKGNAWSRLEDSTKLNELAILAPSTQSPSPIAFMAPDVRYAICRYDLSKGPLQLRAPLPNDLWSIALYSQHGENYYVISGRDVQSKAVNLLVVVDKTIDNEKQEEQSLGSAGKVELREITVAAPAKTGMIVIRAPVPKPAFTAEVSTLLAQAFCRPITFDQQASRSR